jgi:hypothetical protein
LSRLIFGLPSFLPEKQDLNVTRSFYAFQLAAQFFLPFSFRRGIDDYTFWFFVHSCNLLSVFLARARATPELGR